MQILRPRHGLGALFALYLQACDPSSASAPPADAAAQDASSDLDGGRDAAPDASPPADRDAAHGASDAAQDAEPSPPMPPPPCETVAPSTCPEPIPGYAADLEPLFEQHCVTCHWGEPDGPWPLDSYSHVAAWAMEIRAAMLDCSMPPADADQPAMPLEDRQKILTWLRCGAPE